MVFFFQKNIVIIKSLFCFGAAASDDFGLILGRVVGYMKMSESTVLRLNRLLIRWIVFYFSGKSLLSIAARSFNHQISQLYC